MELDDKELEKLKELVPYKILSPTPQEIIAEIERLNNIINEFEKYINEEYIYDELGMKIFDASELQDKLRELKGIYNRRVIICNYGREKDQ